QSRSFQSRNMATGLSITARLVSARRHKSSSLILTPGRAMYGSRAKSVRCARGTKNSTRESRLHTSLRGVNGGFHMVTARLLLATQLG
ncbi:hypothetical protein IWW50_005962, partial [Coemansia erecta]